MEAIEDPWESSKKSGSILTDFDFQPTTGTRFIKSLDEDHPKMMRFLDEGKKIGDSIKLVNKKESNIFANYKYKDALEKSLKKIISDKQPHERYEGEHIFNRLRYLNRCIKLEPTNPIFFRQRADYFYDKDQSEKFFKDNLKVIEYANEKSFEFRYALDLCSGYDFAKIGFDQYQSKEYEKSIKFYKIALKFDKLGLKKDLEKYYSFIAQAEYFLGRYKKSLIYFKKAINLNSKSQANYLFKSGCVNLKLEKYEDSLKDFKKANKLKPNNDHVHYFLGKSADGLGDNKNAKIYYEKCLDLNIDYKDAQNALIALMSSEKSLLIKNAYYIYNKGLKKSAQGKDQDAVIYFDMAEIIDKSKSYIFINDD